MVDGEPLRRAFDRRRREAAILNVDGKGIAVDVADNGAGHVLLERILERGRAAALNLRAGNLRYAPGTLYNGISLPLNGVMATVCSAGSACAAAERLAPPVLAPRGRACRGRAAGAAMRGAARCGAGAAFFAGFGGSGCDWMIFTGGSSTAPGEGAAPGCCSAGAAGASGAAPGAGGCGAAGAGTVGGCGCVGAADGACLPASGVCAAPHEGRLKQRSSKRQARQSPP